MKKMRPYKGYTATVAFDSDEMVLHGRVDNLRDVISFQASSVADLQREFKAAVDDYLDYCKERGEQPDKPFSGRFVLRLDPAVHRDAALAADRWGVSLNTWVTAAVDAALSGAPAALSEESIPVDSADLVFQETRIEHLTLVTVTPGEAADSWQAGASGTKKAVRSGVAPSAITTAESREVRSA